MLIKMDVRRQSGFLAAIFVIWLSGVARCNAYSSPFRDDTCINKTQCKCISNNELELDCPKGSPNINLKVEPALPKTLRAELECHNFNRKVFSSLPQMNLTELNQSPVEYFKFKYCPLPEGTTIKGIIVDQLGIRSLRMLEFYSHSAMEVRRDKLKGLTTVRHLRYNGPISELPDDAFDDLVNITILELRSINVHLPLHIFRNLHNLNYLEIVSNNLSHLPAGIFSGLRKLTRLNINSNNLSNLTKDTFMGATSIVELDLNKNNFEILPGNVFEHLINMENINLNGNRFTELPVGLFSQNKKLIKFRLLYNSIDLKTLPIDFLADLPQLTEVSISNAQSLPEDMFSGSTNIKMLSMQFNKFTTLPSRIFNSQVNLTDLNLSNNQLTELPNALFSTTVKLEVLDLSKNNLRNISAELFRALVNLRELRMNDNDLHTIHPEAFEFTTLQVLHLENNHIDFGFEAGEDFLITPFQHTKNLQKLFLQNNSITHFINDLNICCWDLSNVDLSHNQISSIDLLQIVTIRNQRISIDLTYNQIKTINTDKVTYLAALPLQLEAAENASKRNPGLEWRWNLNHNQINCDCEMLYFVKFLTENKWSKFFKLETSELRCASPDKLHNQLVQEVNLGDLLCELDNPNTTKKYCPEECECMVRSLDETVLVNCSNRNLTHVPRLPVFDSAHMKWTMAKFELNIENNNISKLPNISHPGYKNVVKINARNNLVAAISRNELPPRLNQLDLMNNRIETFDAKLLEYINVTKDLKLLQLANNPLVCECDSDFMLQVQWIQRKVDFQNITCADGQLLGNTPPNCPYLTPEVIVLICLVAGLLGLLIGIVFALYYKYEHEVKVWMFKYKLCLWWVTEEELDKDKKFDAFISFSHIDENFITEKLVPELEKQPNPFKICLHFRDWVPGEFIPNQISKSVEDSRRTIVVLSPNFIDSIWGRMEFRLAHLNALREGRARVIVIILGDLGDVEKLDAELKAYLKTNTYVKWGDPWFFDKLRYAMPHPTNYKSKGLIKSTMKSSIDDKLELIKPQAVTPPLTTPPAEQAGQNLIGRLNSENARFHSGLNGINGHVNGAFIINTNAKQSDV